MILLSAYKTIIHSSFLFIRYAAATFLHVIAIRLRLLQQLTRPARGRPRPPAGVAEAVPGGAAGGEGRIAGARER